MKLLIFIVALISPCAGLTQNNKILHYAETSGFDHGTRTVSLQMFQNIALAEGFQIDDDQTGDAFNTLSNLQQYAMVVFSNTSGNSILDATQRANFESYINGGGSYLGIHAATDTYRHSTANGSSTGTWDFYAELVGASVQQNPNHVSGTPQYDMNHIGMHPTTENLPDLWTKNEEYYYWENGFFGNDNSIVLEVEETLGPNNMVNSYDVPRPMSWYRELNTGGKMFYTALGHATSNYTSDQNFIQHITDALLWIVSTPTSSTAFNDKEENLVVAVSDGQLHVHLDGQIPDHTQLRNILGQTVLTTSKSSTLETKKLPAGLYLLEASDGKTMVFRKVYLN